MGGASTERLTATDGHHTNACSTGSTTVLSYGSDMRADEGDT